MKKLFAILGVLLISLLIFPQLGLAQDSQSNNCGCPPDRSFCIRNPLCDPQGDSVTSIPDLIDRVAHFVFLVGLAIAPVMILVAAMFFITAGGKKDQVTKAKKIIIWTLVGVAVLYLADILMSVIRSALGVTN